MKRHIEDELLKWKHNKGRKPLILRGARQVGKTYSIKQFGSQNYSDVAYCDLERNQSLHAVFSGDLDARRMVSELEVMLGRKISPERTLLVLDEIQACPRAIMSLRYFNEELPDLHVIAAGSLLEFAMRDISFPVGRVEFLTMYPLTFAEYLSALGRQEAAEIVLGKPAQLPESLHTLLMDELRRYFFVGGMPQAVKACADAGSIREAFSIQEGICETLKLDFAKYSPRVDKLCLQSVLASISKNVSRQLKYASLAEGYSNPTIKKAFELLCLAKIASPVRSVDPSGLPLGASASAKIFKAVLVDIGVMRFLCAMPVEVEYPNADLLKIYKGAMAEQFAGQEMMVSQKGSLYYWSRPAKSSSAEVDYVAVIGGAVVPVEIKSAVSGRLKSLHLMLDTYKNCPRGLVFSSDPRMTVTPDGLEFLPLYWAGSATRSGS
ncbi:MAG: ATP-binding protein [Chitinispirillaceae bacterium]|nr:ATP-binding protein [Chitinispirillaceae bacterium]